MDFKDELLCSLLHCGVDDLCMLEKTQYDFGEIVEELNDNGIPINLNSVLEIVFMNGVRDLTAAVEAKKEEVKESINVCEDDELKNLHKLLDALNELEPDKDVSWYLNFLCSEVTLSKYGDYAKYFGEEIEKIETDMGIEFRVGNR